MSKDKAKGPISGINLGVVRNSYTSPWKENRLIEIKLKIISLDDIWTYVAISLVAAGAIRFESICE